MRIKSRKEREREYDRIYGNISDDSYVRLKEKLGSKFNEELMNSVLYRLKEANENIEYNCLSFTFYEIPVQTHRPRKSKFGMYVPNAKANHSAMEKFLRDLKYDIDIICVPIKIMLRAYNPMPSTVNPVDMVVYEIGADYAIGKPDFDNILKAYCDMIQELIILDDDLVVSCQFDKFYSLKPRVEMDIIYPNGIISEYAKKTIENRKSYKTLKNNGLTLLVKPLKSCPKRGTTKK